MKLGKTLKVGSILLLASGMLAACSSNTSNNTTSSTQQTSENKDTAKTVTILATGDYKVGEDIQPGSYYAVLTKLDRGSSGKENYISYSLYDSNDKYLDGGSYFKTLGKAVKINLKRGNIAKFYDSETVSWEITLYSSKDFKDKKTQEKISELVKQNTATSSEQSSSP